MRRTVLTLLAGLLLGATGLGCGDRRTGSAVPTTLEPPRTQPTLAEVNSPGTPKTFIR
jgi:hypothetical protein